MTVTNLANEIWIENGESSSTSVPAIAYWIRAQLGRINTLLFEEFSVNESTYEIQNSDESELSLEAAAIIKQIYVIYDYQNQVRSQMNAMASDAVLSFREADGSSFTRVNRNSISQTLASLRKDEIETLKGMVNAYRSKKCIPGSINGDDTEGYFGNLSQTSLRVTY